MHAVSHPARIGLGARKASRQKIADAYRRTLGRNQRPATSDLHVPDAIFCPHLSLLACTGWSARSPSPARSRSTFLMTSTISGPSM